MKRIKSIKTKKEQVIDDKTWAKMKSNGHYRNFTVIEDKPDLKKSSASNTASDIVGSVTGKESSKSNDKEDKKSSDK